jgi:hypothetical protein
MIRIYILALVLCVSALVYLYGMREHLTAQEVNNKVTPIEKRVETLEEEYKAIQQKMTKQEAQAKAATAQATNLQAALHKRIRS